jgi:hypothetical protein
MMQRHLQYRKADLAVPRRGRERAGKADRIGIGSDAVKMMLGEPDHIDAEFVRKPGLAQGLVDHGPIALEIAAVGEQKIAEFHPALPSAIAATARITGRFAQVRQATAYAGSPA